MTTARVSSPIGLRLAMRAFVALGLAGIGVASCAGGSGKGSAPPQTSVPLPGTAPGGAASAAAAADPSLAGKLACGAATCDAHSEVCCLASEGAPGGCVARPAGGGELDRCPDATATIVGCDDASDCAAAERCCQSYDCTGEGCPTRTTCEKGLCAWGIEVCVAGSGCGAGFRCQPDAGGKLGRCLPDSQPAVACGGSKRCPPAARCCWNTATNTGACADACPEREGVGAFACTSPAECGGYPCHDMVPGPPWPSFFCGSEAEMERAGTVLCAAVADCPPRRLYTPDFVEATGCSQLEGGPPGVKACDYATGED